ncbi:MAG: spore germination protein GerW family protein [Methanothrix sp.]
MSGVDASGATLNELFYALSAQLIGEQIELDDKIIIPINKMSMGFGANINIGRIGPDASKEGQERCIAGGVVGIFPAAVVVVFKEIPGQEGVKVVPLSQRLK